MNLPEEDEFLKLSFTAFFQGVKKKMMGNKIAHPTEKGRFVGWAVLLPIGSPTTGGTLRHWHASTDGSRFYIGIPPDISLYFCQIILQLIYAKFQT